MGKGFLVSGVITRVRRGEAEAEGGGGGGYICYGLMDGWM